MSVLERLLAPRPRTLLDLLYGSCDWVYDMYSQSPSLAPAPIEPRSFGPSCHCHGRRNMERMGYCLYRCQESGETFQMLVHDGHIAMVPLETGKALEEIK